MTSPEAQPGRVPRLTCWGAARTVSGSMHVIEVANRLIVLDCGLFQGRRSEAYQRNSHFPFHTRQLAAVIVTHAHIDHCGNLPNLVRQGYRGPIFATPLTADLAAVMLADAARVQEEDSAHVNIKRQYAEPWIEPLYTGPDSARATGLFQRVAYNTPFEVIPGVQASFHDAGHIPGSAMIHLAIQIEGQNYSLTYTGDLGRRDLGVLPPAAPVPPADLVLAECTYGGRRHPSLSAAVTALGDAVNRVTARDGKLLIPAFGLGRSQLVVHYLLKLMDTGRVPRLPIFVDSPLASAVANVYHAHPEAFREDVPGDQGRVRYVQSFQESLALCDRPESCVIVAAGGMCEGGRIVQHIAKHVADPATCIALVSYQAPRTLGGILLERPSSVHVMGRDYPLRAEIVHIQGLSSHADHDDLMAQLGPLANTGARIRLIHGEPAAAEALEVDLRAAGIRDVAHPDSGESEDMHPFPNS